MSAPERAYYRFVDSSRISGPNVQYFLAEKEWRASRVYGPYRVDTGALPQAAGRRRPSRPRRVERTWSRPLPHRARGRARRTRPLAPALDLKADVFRGGSAQRI
ncbi:MAG: hypothetical protein R2991_05125 [Thermoanaerobaculia bacterium]